MKGFGGGGEWKRRRGSGEKVRLAFAEDDDQAQAPLASPAVIKVEEEEVGGGPGCSSTSRAVAGWAGLKCSTAVLCCTARFAAANWRAPPLNLESVLTVKEGLRGLGCIYDK